MRRKCIDTKKIRYTHIQEKPLIIFKNMFQYFHFCEPNFHCIFYINLCLELVFFVYWISILRVYVKYISLFWTFIHITSMKYLYDFWESYKRGDQLPYIARTKNIYRKEFLWRLISCDGTISNLFYFKFYCYSLTPQAILTNKIVLLKSLVKQIKMLKYVDWMVFC